MSVTIRIDQDVYESLKAKAEPFVDTPNSVLRRLLNLDGLSAAAGSATMAVRPPPTRSPGRGDSGTPASHKRKRKRRAKRASTPTRTESGAILVEERYELPILGCLIEAGGSAPSRQVIDAVGRELADQFSDTDKATLASGGIRWQNRAQFVRLRLVHEGLMQRDSPRGIWAITEAGRQLVARRPGDGSA